jgi:hypothetical protein
VSEHTALDCNFLELVPQLYRDVELEVVLHAACDTEPHTRRGNTTYCAGPAAIRLKVGQGLVEIKWIRIKSGSFGALVLQLTGNPPTEITI